MIRGRVQITFAAAAIFAMMLLGCGKSKSTSTTVSGQPAAAKLTIAVIPKGTTQLYWKSIHAGAEQAGKDLGVTIDWKGPLQENDRAGQISIVQQFISNGVNGIVLAPLDADSLVRPVQSAAQHKIPVIIIDSSLHAKVGKDYLSYVGTNNELGGKMGGEALIKAMGGKGKVVMLREVAGSASTDQREAGFMDAIKNVPGIIPISTNQHGGANMGDAETVALNMVDRLREANGIFCPNESTAMGMLLALRQNNLTKKVKFVGFDTSPVLINALKDGEINALVAQDPYRMGYLGVKTCVNALRGQKVPPNVDSGVHLITAENLNTPAIQKVLELH